MMVGQELLVGYVMNVGRDLVYGQELVLGQQMVSCSSDGRWSRVAGCFSSC